MSLFYINENVKISYDQLIEDVNSSNSDTSVYGIMVDILCNLVKQNKFKNIDQLNLFLKKNSEKLVMNLKTSGTTGEPKQIKQKFSNVIRYVKKTSEKNIWGLAYNPEHFAGLQVLFQCLFNKDTVVILFGKDFAKCANQIKTNNVDVLACTPTFISFLLQYKEDLFSLKSISLGGERTSKTTINRIKSHLQNVKVRNIYASTEAGSLLCSDGEYFKIPKRYSDLIKIEDNILFIRRDLMGELKSNDEWYNTGDVVRFLDGERFAFDSRQKEFFNVGGNRVSPAKIEEAINSIEEVISCFVYPIKSSLVGNVLAVQIVSYNTQSSKYIKNKIRALQSIKDYERPKIIKFVDSFETTNTGKVKRT